MLHDMTKCNKCGSLVKEAIFSSSVYVVACTNCGVKNDYSIVTAEYVWQGIWWLPRTWFNYGWEEKGKSEVIQ